MPPDGFLPVMEDVLKKETEFQVKLKKFKEMPDDVEANRDIAILFLQRQQLEKALPISEKMPDDAELNREFANYYLGKDQIKEALLISEKMPDDVELNRSLAFYYLGKKQMEKALLISEKMPDDVKLNNQIAISYLKQGKIEDADPFSNKVFSKDPKNKSGLLSSLHLQFGLAYAVKVQAQAGSDNSDLAEMAVKHFNIIIDKYAKSNNFDPAQYYLGITYSLNKQYDKSIEVFEKLINHTDNDPIKKAAETQLAQVRNLVAEAETDN